MESMRPMTSGQMMSDKSVAQWQRDVDMKSENNSDRPKTSVSRPQTRHERPISRRGTQNQSTRVGSALRTGTPGRSGASARPPSASAYSNRGSTANPRSNNLTSAMGMSRLNTGLPPTSHVSSGVFDRPITQHGIAGMRPATTRGLPMTRQIQDKRYYEGLIQLKLRELNQEIAVISNEIEAQKKERVTFAHYDNRAKELAAELTELQGKLADYNIVMDKVASNIDKDDMEDEVKEIKSSNERMSVEIDNLFEQRRFKEQKLRDMEERIEIEEKKADRIIEAMDPNMREMYDNLVEQRNKLQNDIGDLQKEMDLLSSEKFNLEEQIALSSIKQEAVKLEIKIAEAEEKRSKLLDEQKNKMSPDEEREHLLTRVKQDNMDIVAAERKIAETENKIREVEQELEQLETDFEDNQSEKQIKYNELRKREEAIEQFMPNFEQSKEEELKKLGNLEDKIVESLRKLAYATDHDINQLSLNDEMAIFNIPSAENVSKQDQSFEELSKEHIKLKQSLIKMESLEKKLNNELNELTEKIKQKENELIILEDLEGLKARSEAEHEELIMQRQELKNRQPEREKELLAVREEYEKLKTELEKNDLYLQISALEDKFEKLTQDNENIMSSISESENQMNYQSLKEQVFVLLEKYNSLLRDNVKSI
ncbi:intraflagellar transport protein 74 homolog [Microplitis mediator]|uniref:intraflagellar transport protein 74 homolog n=1 Tax=Microplitis mediator TaxID=375433 RepID=UPI0025541258|nr:intraflagellar transport protein 74 homolog [Microplitis mediator]